MNSKVILIIGFFTTLFYITLILFINNSFNGDDEVASSRFSLNVDNKNVNLSAKLPFNEENSTLVIRAVTLCKKRVCLKSLEFEKVLKALTCSSEVEKLIKYIDENNLTKASLVANSKDLELNFLLKSSTEITELKKIYRDCKNVTDNSSVLEVFDISSMETKLSVILKDLDLGDDTETINFKNRRVLNRVFRKLRELGKSKVSLSIVANDNTLELLKKFIKNSYPWIEDITVLKSDDKNSIKIKGVLDE